MNDLLVHEAAKLFPMLDNAELDELAADIAKNGQIEPIVVFEGKILDGRNRVEACRRLQVEPRVRELEACDSPTEFVISANFHRRHLAPIHRATCAARAKPFFASEAEARQRTGKSADGDAGGRGNKKPCAQSASKVSREDTSTQRAAQAFKAGERAVASLWSLLTSAPEVFAAAETGKIPTVADAVRIGRFEPKARAAVLDALDSGTDVRQAIGAQTRAERVRHITEVNKGNAALVDTLGCFEVLLADPPWRYEHVKTESRAIENQYPTMDLDDICALPVSKIAADNSVLFLWATSPKLAEAMRVIEAWNFTFRTCAVWIKDRMGMGYYFRQRHELLLVAARGSLPVPQTENRVDSVIEAPLSAHSAKPPIVAELIEQMYPEYRRIELFCRSPRPGWAVWGNQSGGQAA